MSAGQLGSAALVMRIAGRPGPTFVLRPDCDNTLGRSPEATIVVADRLASRIHAAVRFSRDEGAWVLEDLGSRNGTELDGADVASAVIADGAVIRVGTSELVFRLQPEPVRPQQPIDHDQFIRCGPVSELEGSVLRRTASGSSDDVRRPLLLYQASVRLLAARSAREVIEAALALAAEHTGGTGVGWFRVAPPDRLEPVCVVPPGSAVAALDPTSARLVAVEGQAVWIAAAQPASDIEIACVPIMEAGRPHAALAAAAAPGGIRPIDFDFLVALASLASAACSGRAGPPAATQPADLGSQLTVDLESVLLAEAAAAGEEDSAAATAILTAAAAVQAAEFDDATLWNFVLAESQAPESASPIGSAVAETGTLRLAEWQRMLVVEALRRAGGSLPQAASALGVSPQSLASTLRRYGVSRP